MKILFTLCGANIYQRETNQSGRQVADPKENSVGRGIERVRHIVLSVMVTTLVFLGGILTARADGAVYYLSPTGSNTSPGTSTQPWKTWASSLQKLNPGDTLIVKNGTYGSANGNGYPYVTCGNGYKNGTASQPITVKAENERMALIKNPGASPFPFYMSGCSYWVVEGLRIEWSDASGITTESHVMTIANSSNVTLRRLIVGKPNRYASGHVIYFEETTNSLIEENEIYSFHRHGILLRNGSTTGNNTVRRNYVNSRGYADIPGGINTTGIDGSRGDGCMLSYPSNNNIYENNIVEDCGYGYGVIAGGDSRNDKFLGNVVGPNIPGLGIVFGYGASFVDAYPTDNVVQDAVVIDHRGLAALDAYGINNKCINCSFLGTGSRGLSLRKPSDVPSTPKSSFTCTNCLSVNHAEYGFVVSDIATWLIEWPGAFNKTSNFSPPASDPNIVNEVIADPQLGSCKVFIPSGSPMKGKGKNGADIGANVLYRYENGVLTNKPLWDPATGKFPCGATVAGVNDRAGSSCFDVHKRLNVNTNGCSLPSGYGQTTTALPAPSNLRKVQ
jgi:Right handed beta helix region